MKRQESLFEGVRMSMQDSIDLTAQSLMAYGSSYKHWAVAFSGGKDWLFGITCGIPQGRIVVHKGQNSD